MRVEQAAQDPDHKQRSVRSWARLRSTVGLSLVGVAVVAISLWAAPGLVGVLGAALGIVVVSIAAIDVRHYIIPDVLNAAALILGLIDNAVTNADQMLDALALALIRGALLALAFFALRVGYLWVRGRVGIGLGDVKLAAVMGVWIDWPLMGPAVQIAAVSGLCTYLLRQYALGRPIVAGGRLPFGAFLAPAIWLGWLLDQTVFAPSP